jgi:DNA-binding SARP family transcriptional activator/RecA/RadA recombinase
VAVLQISLLGPFQVFVNDKPVIHFESNKVRALLAYLAAEPDRQHRREVLADLLWSAYPRASALANLRFTISSLQKSLDNPHTACLNVWRDSLQINPSAQAAVDAWEFTRLLRLPDAPSLESAASLYRGAFLEGFSLPDSAPFEEWLALKREQYARLVLKALNDLAHLAISQGRYEPAQQYAWRQVEIEPWLEEGYQQLMRALALSGQRSAALAQFDACRKLLLRELGIEPGRETLAIYSAICKDDLQALSSARYPSTLPAQPARQLAHQPVHQIAHQIAHQLAYQSALPTALPAASPTALPTAPPFVGFEAELAWLGNRLDEALAHTGRVVFISGDFGSGKTSLAQEFVSRALDRHPELAAACGACSAALGFSDACLAFREILQMLTRSCQPHAWAGPANPHAAARLEALLPHTLQHLFEEAPELVEHLLSPELLLEKAQSLDTQLAEHLQAILARSSQRRTHPNLAEAVIFEKLTRFLFALSEHAPLLLVLDDMQWADAGTTGLLFHLGRRINACRLLILVLYRPGDLFYPDTESWQPLERVIDELKATPTGLALDLDRLGRSAFFDPWLDPFPVAYPASFKDALYHTTQGIPLYVIELLRGLQERGNLAINASGAWAPAADLDWESLPPRLEALVAGRMHRLPEPWLRLLQAASIEGEQFTAELASALTGLDVPGAVHWLGGPLCRGMRLVDHLGFDRPQGRPLSCYRFTIPLYRTFLYNQMDESERAALHAQAAAYLESLYDPPPLEIARQIARHYQGAHQPENARKFLAHL